MDSSYFIIENNPLAIDFKKVPVIDYDLFFIEIEELMKDESNHCISYQGLMNGNDLNLICVLADDRKGHLKVFKVNTGKLSGSVKSLTPLVPGFHNFEREIFENFGLKFEGHPWLKPLRQHSSSGSEDNYQYYEIEGDELHEVGVGPIHAGVIEPGYFRFICNGEKVLHLEIRLGYQHRGIEKLLSGSAASIHRAVLCESIAGDTSVGHSLAHSQLIESLTGIEPAEKLQIERCIALELERIAVHIGDTAALCGDVAYQLGQVVCEALRTSVINTTQNWCGNRFGKGLIRPGGTNYPMTETFAESMLKTLEDTGKRYSEITARIYSLPSVLSRFEDIGIVTAAQALSIGTVGMSARSSGVERDIRVSHPFQYYRKHCSEMITIGSGDVLARAILREKEVNRSISVIRDLVGLWKDTDGKPDLPSYTDKFLPGRYAVSLVEGWRGEIFHSAITDENGSIVNYKVKDPSFHNWLALALAVRNQEISDFPVCNKSFNLSYCGFDL